MTILLVRLRLIGDVVFTTPVIRALRRRFPEARLLYLVERAAAPVVASNPHLNEVITIPHRSGVRRVIDDLAIGHRLSRMGIDIAIDLHGGPRAGWLTWSTRAPLRVGYDVTGRSWMYTRVVHRPRVLRPRHSVENQWDLLAAIDPALAEPPDPETDRVEMPVDAGARDRAGRRLTGWGVPPGARAIIIHVSAGNPFRRWPESAFADLAAGLVTGGADRWVLLTGGPSDAEAVARVLAAARAKAGGAASRLVDAEGLSLTELRAAMDRASLFVGGDSGPLHIASTSDVPIVGLYGPTLAERSAPWRPRATPTIAIDSGVLPCRPCDQRTCVPGDFRCLSGIAASRVREAAERVLQAEAVR